MNTLTYAYLIKDLATHKQVAKKQRIKTILFWLIYPLCLLTFVTRFLPEKISEIVMSISGGLMLVYLVTELVYNLHFFNFVNRKRKEQHLSEDDRIDSIFLRLNQKYSGFARFAKKVIVGAIIAGTAAFILSIALLVTGEALDNDAIQALGLACLVLFLIALFGAVLGITFKQMSFARQASEEIEQIKRYFYKIEGLSDEQIASKKRNIFSNIYENQKAITYLYPDEEIRKKVQKLSTTYIVPLTAVGAVFGGVTMSLLLNGKNKLAAVAAIILGAILAIYITLYMVAFSRITRRQRLILESDRERYQHYLVLADLTKKNQKLTNIVSLATIICVAAVCVALCVTVAKSGIQIGFVVMFSLIGWLFIFFATFIPLFKSYRKKARQIEHLIDKESEPFIEPFSDSSTKPFCQSTDIFGQSVAIEKGSSTSGDAFGQDASETENNYPFLFEQNDSDKNDSDKKDS